ncbi:hypothetical protein, partial [Alteribacter natronophilus]|uniref:hypothetical protein n=1 Tax=Alteribacter natronophilus TaxID=2583810 RepID=UPI001AED736C
VVTRYPYRKVGMDHLLSKELLKLKQVSTQVSLLCFCLVLRGHTLKRKAYAYPPMFFENQITVTTSNF